MTKPGFLSANPEGDIEHCLRKKESVNVLNKFCHNPRQNLQIEMEKPSATMYLSHLTIKMNIT